MPTRHVLARIGACLLVMLPACTDRAASAAVAGAPGESDLAAPRTAWIARPAGTVIGVTEGEEPYLLHDAVSSRRLTDGRIAVLDGASRQIRFFDETGKHLYSVGRKGDGPGEYRFPQRLYLLDADTILVWDMGTGRETRLDAHGELLASGPWTAPGHEVFPRDAWLYGRNFIDGPRTLERRPWIRAVLDRLPPLTNAAQYRHVNVDDHGRIWVRAMPQDPTGDTEWQVWGLDGSALARLSLPADFEPQHIGPDFIVGRTWDALRVESIRLYRIDQATVAVIPAAPISAGAGTPATGHTPSAELRERMLAVLRHAMTQQEIHYSMPAHGYSYASRADALNWPEDLMEGLVPHILEGTSRGWAMLLFHERENVACGVKQGAGGPIGWTGGIVLCP